MDGFCDSAFAQILGKSKYSVIKVQDGVPVPALRKRRGHPRAGENITDSRRPLTRAYMDILSRWLAFGDIGALRVELPEHAELAERIYRWLGPPEKVKVLRVERLRFSLGQCSFPVFSQGKAWSIWMEMKKVFDDAIQQELGEARDETARLNENMFDSGLCHHAFFRHIDNLIAHIGRGTPVRLPEAGVEGRRVRGATTDYVHALGSWLMGRSKEEAIEIWPDGEQVVTRLYTRLGAQSPRKKWLVASLWKHLQDSDRNRGHGPLTQDPDRFSIPKEALSVYI